MADESQKITRKIQAEFDSMSESSLGISNSSSYRPAQHEDSQSLTDDSALNELSDVELFKPISSKRSSGKEGIAFAFVKKQNKTMKGRPFHFRSPQEFKDKFGVPSKFVHFTGADIDGALVVIIAKELSPRHVIVKFCSDYYCLEMQLDDSSGIVAEHELNTIVSSRETEEADIVTFPSWRLIGEERRRASKSKTREVRKTLKIFCNKTEITPSDLLNLPNFSVVQLFAGTAVEWRIYHRFRLHCDKRYIVRCNTLNTLVEIKRKFLDILRAEDRPNPTLLSIDSVWFTQHSQLVTESFLRESFDSIIANYDNIEDFVDKCRLRPRNLQLSENSETAGCVCLDEVYVHFQPKDAVPVQVLYKNEEDSSSDLSALVVLSPHIQLKDFRQEVSKVVRQQASSIRITVGTFKLRSTLNLSKELNRPDCKIMVSPKKAITLFVYITSIPPSDKMYDEVSFYVYSYDTLNSLKGHVCHKAAFDEEYQVDIFFDGRPLDESKTFSDNRIKDKDRLEARAYLNRLKIMVVMPNRRTYDLLIDDSTRFIVGQIKEFARTMDGVEPLPSFEITAIVNDKAVADNQLLCTIKSGAGSMFRIILVKTENVCFSASTNLNGTLAVLQPSPDERNGFQYRLAMSNGQRLFCAADILSYSDVLKMLEDRRQYVNPPAPVQGIRIVSHFEDFARHTFKHRGTRTSGFSSPSASVSSLKTFRPQENSSPNNEGNNWQSAAGARSAPGKTCVEFHTGNSSTKLNDLDNLQSDMIGKPSTVADDDNSSTVETDCKGLKDGTQKPKSSSNNGSLRRQTPTNETKKVPRSESCPVNVSEQRLAADQSLVSTWKKDPSMLCRLTLCKEIYMKNPDGMWTMHQETKTNTRLTEDILHQRLSTFAVGEPSVAGRGRVVAPQQYTDQTSSKTIPDPAYLFIKQEIIEYIARNLGNNGNRVIRKLKLNEYEIDSAETRYPKDLYEKYFYLLRCWLTMEGEHASVDKLKRILKEAERCDLAFAIDGLVSPATTNTHENTNSGNISNT